MIKNKLLSTLSKKMPRLPAALKLHGPQIEYVGKLIKQAKRRVLWKFVSGWGTLARPRAPAKRWHGTPGG
jgi:hypothetical protein